MFELFSFCVKISRPSNIKTNVYHNNFPPSINQFASANCYLCVAFGCIAISTISTRHSAILIFNSWPISSVSKAFHEIENCIAWFNLLFGIQKIFWGNNGEIFKSIKICHSKSVQCSSAFSFLLVYVSYTFSEIWSFSMSKYLKCQNWISFKTFPDIAFERFWTDFGFEKAFKN